MLIFRVFTDAGCVVGFAIRRFRTKALNHSRLFIRFAFPCFARLAMAVGRSYPGGIAARNPRLLLSLRFPMLRTIGGGGGSKMP